MDSVFYFAAKALVAFIRMLPLRWVARLGRWAGEAAYWLDFRHRKVALANLALWLGEPETSRSVRQLGREHFRRLGENYAAAVKTAFLSKAELEPHVEYAGLKRLLSRESGKPVRGRIIAIGHFGNFELYARLGEHVPLKTAATYRGLRNPKLNELVLSIRSKGGCRFFERRTEAAALRSFLRQRGIVLGLFADQHAGRRGIRLPFLGHDCSVSPAPAIFALRYRLPLHTSICYRTGLGRWRIEIGEEIPTWQSGRPRSIEAITADVNRAFESAVRRDPANWFWVHNRWKTQRQSRPRRGPNIRE